MASNTDYREDGNDFYARRSARHAQHLAARHQKTLESHYQSSSQLGSGVRRGLGLAEGFRLLDGRAHPLCQDDHCVIHSGGSVEVALRHVSATSEGFC